MNTLQINNQEIYQIIMSVGKIEILTDSGEIAYTMEHTHKGIRNIENYFSKRFTCTKSQLEAFTATH
ncbi:hypothetical protein AU074_13685 [Pseudomonas sp. ATCC PTA-122608]|uniref:hypothetical protein n=1 Tax=Pseudomonas sp. ATCC PTA-122608 TaxID=1771311 RepID=UPI00096B8B65|nr:hypothetical protein [Pseudomonas sp. ATCC PTA-122608]OLY72221.1 hypothetical protein AU074_13685 [Pseudomonas sp. ATCC PTA-122608]